MNDDTPALAWYFDFVSPFAYLQWPRVRELAARRPVALRPFLLGALFNELGVRAPPDIPGKRTFLYRFALWRARRDGRRLVFPPAHPFNPLPALRLCLAAGTTVDAVEQIFDWIWGQGRRADSVDALVPLAATLGIGDPATAMAAPAVKQGLREHYAQARAAGVFGAPTLAIGEELFWGEDAHAYALACLEDPTLLADPEMRRLAHLPDGLA